MKRYLIALLPFAACAVTFEEFYATHPDKDLHRARAAWSAIEFPPPAPTPPTPEEIAAAEEAARAPQVFLTPIEAPAIIVQSHTNAYGIALAADDQGALVTAIVHQSPYHSTNAAAQIAKAFAARAARTNDLAGVRTRAGSANSIAALRAEVRRLAELVEQMGAGR